MFLKLLQNRNVILISALIFAFLLPGGSKYISDYTLYILAVVMIFSLTGVKLNLLKDYKSTLKVSGEAILYNFIFQGILLLGIAYFSFDKSIFNGFVVLAATPPGVAVIPFTYTFKGNQDFSFRGILGAYLASVILSPLIIYVFSEGVVLNPMIIIGVTVKIIVVPLILSRFLLIKKIYPVTEKIRGKIIDWGFALIIYTAVAVNRDLIFNDYITVLKSVGILFLSTFGTGVFFLFIHRKTTDKKLIISKNLMLTIKSSGFAIAVTLILFEEKSAIPAAVMSIFVLLWLITLNIYYSKKNRT
ncbi:MAG: hypothetical protein GXO80_02020 [Chlorobi bacterium]|nr:hypothetical protein [Chlorobiota bacterium]